MKILAENSYPVDGPKSLTKGDIKELSRSLAQRQDSDVPFYLVDLGAVSAKLSEWRHLLPRVKPFYAVKCNPDAAVLSLLQKGGCGFDVASKKEIETVLKMGVESDDLIFANPCKLSSHIKYAAAKSVAKMTFDNVNELRKIKKLHPHSQVLLRISTDDSDSICQFSQKFGATRPEWLNLVATCKELGLDLAGVSFHVGSGCRDVKQYGNSIRDARELFDLAVNYGFQPRILDIGGGFPGFPCETDLEPTFAEIADEVNRAIDACFADFSKLEIIAEPGRFMVSSAFTLITKVTTVRENEAGQCRYYINDGVYGSFNNILHDHAQPKPELLSSSLTSSKCHQTCSIWGPSCDGLDQINDALYFPRLAEGDYLIWFQMGAYTGCVATEFNGFPMPRYFYVPYGATVERLRTSSISEFNTKCHEVGVEC